MSFFFYINSYTINYFNVYLFIIFMLILFIQNKLSYTLYIKVARQGKIELLKISFFFYNYIIFKREKKIKGKLKIGWRKKIEIMKKIF